MMQSMNFMSKLIALLHCKDNTLKKMAMAGEENGSSIVDMIVKDNTQQVALG
jgi:hypothetical protein